MDLSAIAAGIFLTATGAYVLWWREQVVGRVETYFATRRPTHDRPPWLYKKHRPSLRVLRVVIVLLAIYGLLAGIVVLMQGIDLL